MAILAVLWFICITALATFLQNFQIKSIKGHSSCRGGFKKVFLGGAA